MGKFYWATPYSYHMSYSTSFRWFPWFRTPTYTITFENTDIVETYAEEAAVRTVTLLNAAYNLGLMSGIMNAGG